MAFWKKSDDPWDRKPTQTTYTAFEEEPKEEEKGFLEGIRDDVKEWQKNKKAVAEAEANLPPENCPWCGKEMEKGYLSGYRGGCVEWTTKKPGVLFGTAFAEEVVVVTDEGEMSSYKTCWYCRDCCKMTMEVKPAKGPNYTWENGKVVFPEEEGEPHDM